MPRTKKTVQPEPVAAERIMEQKYEITGVLLIGAAMLALASLFFEGAGFIGAILKEGLNYLFGQRGAIIPVLTSALLGCMLLGFRKISFLGRRIFALILLGGCVLIIIHLCAGTPLTEDGWAAAARGSGVVGHFCALLLWKWFGNIGTLIVLAAILMIAFILTLEKPLAETFRGSYTGNGASSPPPVPAKPENNRFADLYQPTSLPEENNAAGTASFTGEKVSPNGVIATLQSMLKEKGKEVKEKKTLQPDPDFLAKPALKSGPYKLPECNLIEQPRQRLKRGGHLPDQSRQLEETLAHFGVEVKVLEVHHGPVITRYDLQPAPGVKVSKIVNLTDDLALALAAKGLRLEAPIPGKAAIGVEVPNKETQVVTFRDMLESKVFWNTGKLTVALGTDIAGEVVVTDLGKMPHLLIAGATGSGKSVCVNTLIMSVLFKAFPGEVKFILIDPKMVELSMYNGIPHLMAPVVTEAKKAAGVLKIVVDEMDRRYKLFAEARVRDLEKYNAMLKEDEKLPYIVIIIDELADLMMVAPVEVEDSICRLAQMARATGIHLVVATQRPSVDVITGLIKANIPSRIAFAVSSQVDSRTILDCMGAERLLGRGDMLFSPVGSMKPRRIQGALVTEKEIEAVIKHWKEQGSPEYQEKFVNIPDKSEKIVEEDDDELFWDAVKTVVDHGQASASILQRRLRVGYARAARLVDMMEAKGIVGPYEGSKPREVYITARQMEEIKNRNRE